MSAARAERRARRAERRRPDGSRGWFARHAWRSLVSGAERGDANAIGALAQAWRRDPAGELWTVASRWLTPADVLAAAVENATDASAMTAIRAFCARHGLVPDDAADRALFFVLTGQLEQYQAHDPDGSLLARGYRAAGEPAREAVRRTMIGFGDLSALRVIADRPDRPLTAAEADYLTVRLAEAGEWDQLWRLIPTVPIASALRAAHLFRDWRPVDGSGRAFLDRLTGAGPDALAALGPAAVTRLDFAEARRLSFAPDNSELAVAGKSGATIFDLPGGSPVASYDDGGYEMVAFGDATIVCRGLYSHSWSLIRCSPEQPRQVLLLPDTVERTLARTPGGFVVAIPDGMWFGTAEGHLSRFVRWNTLPPVHRKTKRLVCADPTTGRLAIYGYDTLLMADADGSVLATAKSNRFGAGVFCAPGHLITVIPSSSGLHYDHTLLSWRYDGTNLVREAEAGCRMVGTLVPVPGHDLVLTHFEDRLWLDTGTLKEAGPPSAFPPLGGRLVTFSQDGSLVAAASRTGVEVHDLAVYRLAALAGRSLTEMGRSGLETVGTPRDHPAVAAVLGLVRAGLEYRFGADIALGPAAQAAARGDDIALGGWA